MPEAAWRAAASSDGLCTVLTKWQAEPGFHVLRSGQLTVLLTAGHDADCLGVCVIATSVAEAVSCLSLVQR